MKHKISKKRKRLCIIIAVCCVVLVFAVYLIAGIVPPTAPDYTDIEILYEDVDFKTEFDSYTDILLSGSTASCEASSVSLKDGNITIRESGVYRFQGELTDGSVYVAADGEVFLVFDNAAITCTSAPAVYISAADKVVFTTVKGTDNSLSATVSGGLESAIYSDTDVTFNGNGTMSISSENGIAINCNANVRFAGGEYAITAKENAVRAAQNVSLRDGTVNAATGSDAIKTTTSGKSNGAWIGVVDISGGTLNVTSEGDGINSASIIHICSGEVNITCSGGSTESAESTEFGGGMQMPGEMGGMNQREEDQVNAKGLKADTGIYLSGGKVYVDCVDDAIHSDGDVTVDGCELHILSNGDGIQGEKLVNIKNGNVKIERALEGICGRYITFDGGMVDITASDDGVNATNSDNPIAALGFEFEILGTGGRIFINGGTLRITSSGDGLDSNGSIKQSGGYVTVTSRSNGVEVPVDYTGTYKMTGGTLAAFGSGGNMMQSITADGSTVSSLTIGTTIQTGNTIQVIDADGNELFSAISEYNATCLILASEALGKGATVTVYVDETEVGSATITESSASIGTVSGGNMGGRPNDMQGGQLPGGQTPPDMQGGQMPGGQTPPDMQGGMQGGQRPNGMQGGQMGGGMRGPFGFVIPIIVILVLGIGITVFVVRRKKKKEKTNEVIEEDEDEDDLS